MVLAAAEAVGAGAAGGGVFAAFAVPAAAILPMCHSYESLPHLCALIIKQNTRNCFKTSTFKVFEASECITNKHSQRCTRSTVLEITMHVFSLIELLLSMPLCSVHLFLPDMPSSS